MRKKFSMSGDKNWEKYRDHLSVRIALYVLLGVTLFLLMVGNIAPEVVEVTLGSRADMNIASPITIKDEVETARAQDKAAKEVEPSYFKDDNITARQIRNLDRVFSQIKDVVSNEELSNAEKLTNLKESLGSSLDEEIYSVFLSYPVEEIETLRRITSNIVYEVMNSGIRSNNLSYAHQRVSDSLSLSSLDEQMREVTREIATAALVPNYVLDQEETERLRQEARDKVGNVMIREGEILVSEGEIISADIYRKLRLVGLLSESANMWPYLGLALYIALLIAALGVYMAFSGLQIQKNNKFLLMYVIIFALTAVVIKIINIFQVLEYTGVGFMVPVAFGTMLMTMLIHQRIAIFSSFLIGLIAAILLNENVASLMDINYLIITIFSGLAGTYFLGAATRKTKILQAGFVVSIVTTVAVLAVSMLQNMTTLNWLDLSQSLLFAFIGGLLASVLTIGLMPFFEAAFNILSNSKLIELSNPNHPLLRKVLVEAPGTYHHSVMVANLAETAAEAIGGNGLLARVGAYYHDVGKTKRPHFFIENQMNMDNPHDKIAPHLSKTIITAHARDGAQMLKEYHLPKAIQDIAEQHHGTTLLKYFYHKAKQESDSDIVESDFRYPGPKAQFKEAAIIGIVDSVEAAVRSMSKPSPERIETVVRSIIRDRLEDGQFDECDLTLKELDSIAKAVCETLQGIFHSRIEYPEDK